MGSHRDFSLRNAPTAEGVVDLKRKLALDEELLARDSNYESRLATRILRVSKEPVELRKLVGAIPDERKLAVRVVLARLFGPAAATRIIADARGGDWVRIRSGSDTAQSRTRLTNVVDSSPTLDGCQAMAIAELADALDRVSQIGPDVIGDVIKAVPRGVANAAEYLMSRARTARPPMRPSRSPSNERGSTLAAITERRAVTLFRRALDGAPKGGNDALQRSLDAALARRGQGQPLQAELRAKMEARFGVDFSRVRIHIDKVAADAARAVHAKAFTVGDEIFFAEHAFDPANADGERLIAHELQHVVQAYQGRTLPSGISEPGDALEREAERTATDVTAVAKSDRWRGRDVGTLPAPAAAPTGSFIARDSDPEPSIDATEYAKRFNTEIANSVMDFVKGQAFATQSPFGSWVGSFAPAMMATLGRAASGGSFVGVLGSVLAPERIDHLVDDARVRDVGVYEADGKPAQQVDYAVGPAKWFPEVGAAVGSALVRRITESLARISPRYIEARNQAFLKLETQQAVCAPNTPAPEPSTGDILPGHPIDPFTIATLCSGGVMQVDLTAYRQANSGSATTKETGKLKPIVGFQFLATKGVWFWVRVTSPADASAEDVAAFLYGSPTAAFRLTGSAPLFGFNSIAELAPAHKETLRGLGVDTTTPDSTGVAGSKAAAGKGLDPVCNIDPAKELIQSPLADEAALAQAKGPPTGANKTGVIERMRQNMELLRDIGESAMAFDLRSRLTDPIVQLDKKSTALNGLDETEALKWDVQSQQQQSVLQGIAEGLQPHAEQAQKMAMSPIATSLPAHILAPMTKVASAYVDAAIISYLPEMAQAKLSVAESLSQQLPADIMDGILAFVRRTIETASTAKAKTPGGAADHASYDTDGLKKREEDLQKRVASLRTVILNDIGAAGTLLEALWKDINDLQLEAEMVGNMDALDAAWQSLADNDGFWAHVTNDHETLAALKQRSTYWHGRWKAVFAKWKGGDHAGAKDDFDKLRSEQDLSAFLGEIGAAVKDAQINALIAQIAAMLIITVATAGFGEFVGGIAAGMRLSAGATMVATSAAEAAAFTTLNAIFFEKNVSAGGVVVDFIYNFALFGALKRFSQFARILKMGEVAKAGVEMTGQAFILGASSLAKEEITTQLHQGKNLTTDEIKHICIQSAAMWVAITVLGQFAKPFMAELQGAGRQLGTSIRIANAEREAVCGMAEALKGSKDPAQALALIQRERVLVQKEIEAYEELERAAEKDPKVLEQAGLSRERIADLKQALGAHAGEMERMQLVLMLEPLGPNHYTCTRERMPDVLSMVGRAKGRAHALEDLLTHAKTYEIIFDDGELVKITEKLDPAETQKPKDDQQLLTQAPRVKDPVKGLFDGIDPHAAPQHWEFRHTGPTAEPPGPYQGYYSIKTEITGPDKSGTGTATGWVERAYNPATKTVLMKNIFVDDLASWVKSDGPGFPDGKGGSKGVPTPTYLTIMQMKLLGVGYGEATTIKMTTIQNIPSVIQLAALTSDGMDINAAVAETQSVSYGTTAITQSGLAIESISYDASTEQQTSLQDLLEWYERGDAAKIEQHDKLIQKFGKGKVTRQTLVRWDYNIVIKVKPWPKQ